MEAALRTPWKPLTHAGGIAFALGVLDLAQFGRPSILVLLHFPNICVSICAGWALLRRIPSALVATTIAGGVVLADTLVSILIVALGPKFLRDGFRLEDLSAQDAAVMVPAILLAALQFVFWPYATALAMRNQRLRGLPQAYAHHARDTVIGAFFISFWISGVLQALIKVQIFRLI